MILSDPLVADHAAVLHRQQWDWFLDLPSRLNVIAQIADQHGTAVLDAPEGHPAARLRALLEDQRDATIHSAVLAAVRLRAAHFVRVDRYEVGCFPVVHHGSVVGALVLARDPIERVSSDLQTLGLWLTTVVEAHLAKDRDVESEALVRVAALQGLLNHAVATGSGRAVVAAFAEALAVWDDIEVRGYFEGVRGEFALGVSLAGSDLADAPGTIDHDTVGEVSGVTRLSKTDAERLGFATQQDVVIAGPGKTADDAWLIALSGRISAAVEARLALYINVLRQAVRHADRVAEARLDWAILQHLFVGTDQVEAAAKGALREVTTAVGGDGAALVVSTFGGLHVLSVVDSDAFSGHPQSPETNQIAAAAQALDRFTIVLAVRGAAGHTYIQREQRLIDRAAGLFASWLSGVLQRPEYGKDRRSGRQSFADVIEQVTEQSVSRGMSVSVAVLAPAEGRLGPDQIRESLAAIRDGVRTSDLVGPVAESEIAVLLAETTSDDADAVVQRLVARLGEAQSGETLRFSIGIVTPSATWPSGKSVVNAARDEAKRRRSA